MRLLAVALGALLASAAAVPLSTTAGASNARVRRERTNHCEVTDWQTGDEYDVSSLARIGAEMWTIRDRRTCAARIV